MAFLRRLWRQQCFFSNLAMTYLPVLPTFCPSCPRVLCFWNFLTLSHRKHPSSRPPSPPHPLKLDSITSNWPQSVYKANPAMLVELCWALFAATESNTKQLSEQQFCWWYSAPYLLAKPSTGHRLSHIISSNDNNAWKLDSPYTLGMPEPPESVG